MSHYRFQNILCIFSLLCCLLLKNSYANQHVVVKPGDCVPNVSLTGQLCKEDKKYLGLSDQNAHLLSSIQAGFILVNCCSIYCPVCQAHANKINFLHKLIQEDIFVGRNIKMIGIGMGNNTKEVAYYKKYHNIPFPLIADPDFNIHKAFKETRIPLLAIIDKRSNPYKILAILDFTKEPEALMEDIRATLRKVKLGH